MKTILEEIQKKYNSIPMDKKINRARRGAYVDCARIIKDSNMKPIVNTELMNSCSIDDFIEMGFIAHYDGEVLGYKEPPTVWGISHDMVCGDFEISIDCACVVTIENKKSGSEPIICHISNKDELENLIFFTNP